MSANTAAIFTPHPYCGAPDLPGIAALGQASEALDQREDRQSVENWRRTLADPQLETTRNLGRWEDAAGQLAALAGLWTFPVAETVTANLYFVVHPDARSGGLGDQVLAWVDERARDLGQAAGRPAEIYTRVNAVNAYGRELLARHGYQAVRHYLRLACPITAPIPAPQVPPGYTLRTVQSAADVQGWVAAFNESFIDHWNFHPTTLEYEQRRRTSATYRPAGDLIAVAPDGTVAAYAFCFYDPENNVRNEGWIGILGTRRGQRGIGLGRAVLRAGLRWLQGEGLGTAVLNVDAENPTGALRLYESAGFTTIKTLINYRKPL